MELPGSGEAPSEPPKLLLLLLLRLAQVLARRRALCRLSTSRQFLLHRTLYPNNPCAYAALEPRSGTRRAAVDRPVAVEIRQILKPTAEVTESAGMQVICREFLGGVL